MHVGAGGGEGLVRERRGKLARTFTPVIVWLVAPC